MSYIAQANLENAFGTGDLKAWTDDDASGTIDAAKVAEAIAAAEGQIDGAAGQHYTVPLSLSNASTAALVRGQACILAGYKLASRRPNVMDSLRKNYEDALAWLKDLADGGVALPGENPSSAARPAGGIVVAGEAAVIDRTKMDGL